jgi:EAL domain-containing protein (putative c-di-GMP-specific phosphodiesterase class I)
MGGATLAVSDRAHIFELTEGERVQDRPHLVILFREYSRFGFRTAIDDFGAGYAGLNLLAEYQSDIVKIDMELVRDIDTSKPKQAIVNGIVALCAALKVRMLAEGIETRAERDFLRDAGNELMQGYFFCRPAFRAIGVVDPAVWDWAQTALPGGESKRQPEGWRFSSSALTTAHSRVTVRCNWQA